MIAESALTQPITLAAETTMAPSAAQALTILRDGSQFSWHIIPLLMLVVYVFFREAEEQNWSRILAAIAFWSMDLFNEIWNGIVFHLSGFAPVWGAPGNDTAFLLLIGLNIEISFMFAITGIAATLALPVDKNSKILGVNNRLLFAVVMSVMSVMVEIFLNSIGALTWEWPWWNAQNPYLIFFLGYMPFYLVCYWVYDMTSLRRQIITVSALLTFDVVLLAVLANAGWV